MIVRLRSLAGASFRANPCVEFVRDVRSPSIRRRDARGDAQYVGILHPVGRPWIGVRAVDHGAAELFQAFEKPRPLPHRLAKRLGRERNRTLAKLVLDGILEVESPDGFTSGADAHHIVFPARTPPKREQTATASLSLAALR